MIRKFKYYTCIENVDDCKLNFKAIPEEISLIKTNGNQLYYRCVKLPDSFPAMYAGWRLEHRSPSLNSFGNPTYVIWTPDWITVDNLWKLIQCYWLTDDCERFKKIMDKNR